MDWTTIIIATAIAFAVSGTLAALGVAGVHRRAARYTQQAKEAIARQINDSAEKTNQQLSDAATAAHQEAEAAAQTVTALRSERMRAVSTFKSLDRQGAGAAAGGDDVAGGTDPISESLMPIAQNAFVRGWAGKYGIDPVAFLQGDKDQVARVEALLPADPDQQDEPGEPIDTTGTAQTSPRRRVL